MTNMTSLPHSIQTNQPRATGLPNPQYRSVSQTGNPFSLHYLQSEYPIQFTLPLSCTSELPQYVIQYINLGRQPYCMICPACGSLITTRIKHISMPLSVFSEKSCLWCPCLWIPCCTEKCLTVKHYCSNCGIFLGKC